MNLMFFINSALLGVGLAMDAFSVSLANGLKNPKMRLSKMSFVAGVYAFFQFAMPLAGWICVHTIVERFRVFEKFVPWIALLLLLFIGGKMLLEGFSKKDDEEKYKGLSLGILMVQGIATSIDALSVGFTIADYNSFLAVTASLIIAGVTFVICMGGLETGKKAGTKLSSKADLIGGTILVAIGIEIFVKGIFF